MSKRKGWQNVGPFPGLGGHKWHVDPSWFVSATVPKAIAGGPPVLCYARNGVLMDGLTLDALVARIERLGFRLVYRAQEKSHHCVLATETGLVRVRWSPTSDMFEMFERGLSVDFATISKADHDALVALLDETINVADKETGAIAVLVQDDDGYNIRSVGVGGAPLERANYAPGVLGDFDHIVSDFRTKDPCGRLVVLSGEPGSGKSFLVRGILAARRRPQLAAWLQEASRADLMEETNRYLADLDAELGPPSPSDLAWADDLLRRIQRKREKP